MVDDDHRRRCSWWNETLHSIFHTIIGLVNLALVLQAPAKTFKKARGFPSQRIVMDSSLHFQTGNLVFTMRKSEDLDPNSESSILFGKSPFLLPPSSKVSISKTGNYMHRNWPWCAHEIMNGSGIIEVEHTSFFPPSPSFDQFSLLGTRYFWDFLVGLRKENIKRFGLHLLACMWPPATTWLLDECLFWFWGKKGRTSYNYPKPRVQMFKHKVPSSNKITIAVTTYLNCFTHTRARANGM